MRQWISEWSETLRIAPPFSRRRRELLAAIAEVFDAWPEDWVEVGEPSLMAPASFREFCHCGRPVHYGFDGDPSHHRGMCQHCDSVRCDAYPGECGQ